MIDGLKPYPTYNASDVPWAGELPSHWTTRQARWLFRPLARPVRDEDEVVTCFRDGVVTLRRNRRTRGFTEAIKEHGYQGIRKGDLVIHAMDAFAGAAGVADSDGKGTPVYAVCEARPGIDPYYYAHVVREMARSNWILALSRGVRERSTDFRYETFAAETVPVPPSDEQAAIARFVDYTDRRIRRYIYAKQKLVKLLEEQRQAVIHRAVTRGLNPNVRFKPSNVEWLGDIPLHWEVLRCRYLFQEVDRRSVDGSEQHLSMSQRLGLVPSHQVENRTLLSESYAGGKLCEVGDLVLNRLKAHLGVFALANLQGVISPDYTVLRPVNREGAAYFEQVLRSPACRGELRTRAKGIVQGFWRLYTDDFYDIRLPVPPVEEQIRIAAHNVAATAAIRDAIERTSKEVALLREYRTRLVADVVTGKLDVRTAATALPRQPAEVEFVDNDSGVAEEDSDDTMDPEGVSECDDA